MDVVDEELGALRVRLVERHNYDSKKLVSDNDDTYIPAAAEKAKGIL